VSQSLANVLLHIIFSTKNRAPLLKSKDLREQLEGYMVGTLKNIECPSIITRTVEDHLHCLCQLSRKISIARLIEEMKTESSKWLKRQSPSLQDFYWQAGYGAFSVSQSNRDQVKIYIANQEEHHRKVTFQDELRALLRRHNIEFDERYVWD
jgi:REP element-mobilizing transposase RayT